MPNLNQIITDEGQAVGSIISDMPMEEGTTKKGTPWLDWDVLLEDGRKAPFRTFGDRANGEARANVSKRIEFYNNNGFTNMREPSGAPKAVSVGNGGTPVNVVKSKSVDPSVWAKKDEEKRRSMAISYSKDLCVAGKVELDSLESTADRFLAYIEGKEALDSPF